jgi:hypothetical protein
MVLTKTFNHNYETVEQFIDEFKEDCKSICESITGNYNGNYNGKHSEDLEIVCGSEKVLDKKNLSVIFTIILKYSICWNSISFDIDNQDYRDLFNDWEVMEKLTQIRHTSLKMINCEIGLSKGVRLGSNSLETLVLSGNQITDSWLALWEEKWDKYKLGIPNLSTLELGNNSGLTEIGLMSCIRMFKELKTLDVQMTGIKNIPELSKVLTSLDLSGTKLNLSELNYKNLDDLKQLSMRKCNLEWDHFENLMRLKNLEKLDMSGNKNLVVKKIVNPPSNLKVLKMNGVSIDIKGIEWLTSLVENGNLQCLIMNDISFSGINNKVKKYKVEKAFRNLAKISVNLKDESSVDSDGSRSDDCAHSEDDDDDPVRSCRLF